jgi:hypothetical protein
VREQAGVFRLRRQFARLKASGNSLGRGIQKDHQIDMRNNLSQFRLQFLSGQDGDCRVAVNSFELFGGMKSHAVIPAIRIAETDYQDPFHNCYLDYFLAMR